MQAGTIPPRPAELSLKSCATRRPSFSTSPEKVARELDLIPRPAGLDANGRPIYRLDELCAKLGATEAEALAFLAEAGEDFVLVAGPVHRAH
jgi:hypothetical protein